jgi:hypothetical protein
MGRDGNSRGKQLSGDPSSRSSISNLGTTLGTFIIYHRWLNKFAKELLVSDRLAVEEW